MAEPIAFDVGHRVDELARRYGGVVDAAAASAIIEAVAPIQSAALGHLAPLTSARRIEWACRSKAVLLVASDLADRCPEGMRWVHSHAGWALACLLEDLVPPSSAASGWPPTSMRSATGGAAVAQVSHGAYVAATARIAPGAVVMAGAHIGSDAVIEPNAVIYGRVRLGARVVIGACAVIGRAGFGWVNGPDGSVRRMPQLGGVCLEDDVEIGPLCTIDAGTLGPTVIRRGAKLDAQVHVGHNGEIDEGVMVAAQSGFAGSVRIGRGALVGGQSGVADHVTVGVGARLAAKSGVIGDVPAGGIVAGYPAVDRVRWLRGMARLLKRGPRRE